MNRIRAIYDSCIFHTAQHNLIFSIKGCARIHKLFRRLPEIHLFSSTKNLEKKADNKNGTHANSLWPVNKYVNNIES